MITFNDEWKGFRDAVLPDNPAPGQVSDMQKAFYAGALVLIGLINATKREFPNDDVARQKALDAVFSEVYNFAQAMVAQPPNVS